MVTEEEKKQLNIMVWAALAMSAISLVVALTTFNQINDISEAVSTFSNQQLEDVSQESQAELAEAQAEARLQTLRARLIAEETINDAEAQITEIRQNFMMAYDDGTEASANQLNAANQRLDLLAQQLRENSADALGTIENMLEELRQNVNPS